MARNERGRLKAHENVSRAATCTGEDARAPHSALTSAQGRYACPYLHFLQLHGEGGRGPRSTPPRAGPHHTTPSRLLRSPPSDLHQMLAQSIHHVFTLVIVHLLL